MENAEKKVEACLSQIREMTDFVPRVALILGSGLGAFADTVSCEKVIPYEEIRGFPVSTVAGHKGRFVLGHVQQTPVVVMQGRVHYYEGYSMSDVVLPTRLMARMGAKILFLTNAAGGISSRLSPADLMLITDQISTFVPSPLIGPNPENYGTRFPSMENIYDVELQDVIRGAARDCGVTLKEGIYLQTTGPAYESPAEVRMMGQFADAVGMSTAVEAIAAAHMGMRVCGISCISNMAGGTCDSPLSHEEVSRMADQVAPLFQELVKRSLEKM